MYRRSPALTALFFSISLAAFANAPLEGPDTLQKCDPKNPVERDVVVGKGVDGDTVHIIAKSGNYSVRLLGIDTPETHYMGQSQGEWGDKAAEFTKDLLPEGTLVHLEFGQEICDGNGRILAHIFKGDLHVNRELTHRGLAVNYCIAPSFKYCEEIGAEVDAAIRGGEGMFSDPDVELPYDFRRRISNRPESSYVGSMISKEVHSPGHEADVPVAERVFFFKKSAIKPPFRLVD